MSEVKHLAINYKTVEDFKKFREYGAQELHMMKEMEGNMIDADIDSPFYGIYVGDTLAARMCLYRKEDEQQPIFDPPHDYMVIWKLEVLEKYQGRGFGSQMIEFAKDYGLPIKAISRQNARGFFEKHGFEMMKYDIERDMADDPLIFYPEGYVLN
ncbi:N-acetyltransferase [Salinicoccus hispanicus]|uniref:N-acetyltransferase n=1 Tax=Salinicoccus hispanicus TaxID=157225 RepID=A0A6N8U126_9STAP|nr:N-acetyltransferase [Salinicoccus hispanicus]MXQ49791.1 N-acetyltransferase [Salinicoccus hispanicus]